MKSHDPKYLKTKRHSQPSIFGKATSFKVFLNVFSKNRVKRVAPFGIAKIEGTVCVEPGVDVRRRVLEAKECEKRNGGAWNQMRELA